MSRPISSLPQKYQEQVLAGLHPQRTGPACSENGILGMSNAEIAKVPKKPVRHDESVMQRAIIKWWSMQHRNFGVPEILLFSIPNGGARDVQSGANLKAQGMRRGVPDLFLAVPRPDKSATGCILWHHGLFLELKTRTGVVSPYQQDFHEELRKQGYRVEVVRSSMEAINAITSYLNNAAHDAAKE